MNFLLKLTVPEKLFPTRHKFIHRAARCNVQHFQRILCFSLAVACPSTLVLAQTSPSSQQSSPPSQQPSSQPSPPQSQPSSQAQSTNPTQPPPKEDSLAEAARKAKEKKSATAKGKVYTEDDISSLKGPGVSVVGEAPKKGARRSPSTDPDGDVPTPSGLTMVRAVDEEIAQKKEEIKKYGSGGFDVTTGMKQNIAYINDRNGQVKLLEKHKADLQKQLDDLQEEGRKAGAAPSWFR